MITEQTFIVSLIGDEIAIFRDILLAAKDTLNPKKIGFKKEISPDTLNLYEQLLNNYGDSIYEVKEINNTNDDD